MIFLNHSDAVPMAPAPPESRLDTSISELPNPVQGMCALRGYLEGSWSMSTPVVVATERQLSGKGIEGRPPWKGVLRVICGVTDNGGKSIRVWKTELRISTTGVESG